MVERAKMRDWCNGSISALQADGVGSRPISRSTGVATPLRFLSVTVAQARGGPERFNSADLSKSESDPAAKVAVCKTVT